MDIKSDEIPVIKNDMSEMLKERDASPDTEKYLASMSIKANDTPTKQTVATLLLRIVSDCIECGKGGIGAERGVKNVTEIHFGESFIAMRLDCKHRRIIKLLQEVITKPFSNPHDLQAKEQAEKAESKQKQPQEDCYKNAEPVRHPALAELCINLQEGQAVVRPNGDIEFNDTGLNISLRDLKFVVQEAEDLMYRKERMEQAQATEKT